MVPGEITAALYKSHLGQHKAAWAEYKAAPNEDKKTFFDGRLQVSNTLHQYMDLSTDKLTYSVKSTIVDVIIREMFFRTDPVIDNHDESVDDEGAAAKKAAKIAKMKVNSMKLFVRSDDDPDRYKITIKNVMHFELAIDHVGIGMSFRQVASAIQFAKIRSNMAELTGANDLIIGQYVRVLVATSLQHIADVLAHKSVWAMSLAGDASTHRGLSFFDLRIRVCFGRKLYKLHLVAIIMFDRHTAEIMNMLANHLTHMNAKYPKQTNRWTHLGRLLMFLKSYHRQLIEFCVANRPNDTPTCEWWLMTFSIASIIDAINYMFAILQSRSLLMAQQESHINALVGTLTVMLDAAVVDQGESDDEEDVVVYETFESMRIQVDSIVAHIHDQSSFAMECYNEQNPDEQAVVVREIAKDTISVIRGLMGVKAERDDANKPLETGAPPLVKLRQGVWVRDVLTPHRVHLAMYWSDDQKDQLEAVHTALLKCYHDDEIMRAAIDSHDKNTKFYEAWGVCPVKFDHFHRLRQHRRCRVDFSTPKWEMDENRTNMMYLSLEDVFQAKQRAAISVL
ncbi:hypothetical protein ACHHYP_14942 [Achlya hypogyna]|uniref:Uncharacterized protein n=1 Tax=Achlya hypogyna TaxID=1202772 RepID=A0A1V9YBX8_ACHHY|nr:hypothetical protein ACHHYP_14942 [Achlya hypogyna]